ncbi:MAG: penicillin-binding protein 2 [Planctomycetes bacterium]|nr:penicillin-binding protein 2 [Planctomycetota bacterium]
MKNVRITIFFSLFLVVAFLALAGRCFYLQFLRNDHYIEQCLKQQKGQVPHKPQRGVILDSRGRVLAASNKTRIIKIEPRRVEDPKSLSSDLQPILNIGAHVICKLITESKNPGYVKIKADASASECQAACRISSAVGVDSDWQRHYPMGRLVSHVVGFTSLDNRGLEGIEYRYDKQLSGSEAKDVFLADVRRRPIRPAPVEQNPKDSNDIENAVLTNGAGIILTIDATIQQFVRDELLRQYKNYEAESAVAIVADPKTGAILAMVSLPDFDPINIHLTEPENRRNKILTDEFEPGSIIKPIVTAIALDAGVVNKVEKIYCEEGHYSGRGFGSIGEYRNGFGDLTVSEILIHSSNIGMAKIGQRLGKERLYNGLRLFGFGKRAGIDLPGEADGLLWKTRHWTGYSITRIPWGQEITVTSIQMLRAFCILANRGRMVRPFLVKAVVDSKGKITELKRPLPPVGYIVKPEVAQWIVSEALVGVVNEGTGKRAKLEKWQVFGKSGTGNIAKSNERGYSDSDYVSSFIAGAPAEDPAIVVLVSVRKPNKSLGKGYTGGVVASPVAGAIIEKTLNYLETRYARADF